MGGPDFARSLAEHGLPQLARGPVTTLQVNVGKRCNQACHHCHVDAGPARTERMTERTAKRVLELVRASPGVGVVDLTGGAPELNPSFRRLVSEARRLFRPILMTSIAFILGVVPLLTASGAGAASQQAIGTVVFGGMLASTLLAIPFVPVFYVALHELAERSGRHGLGLHAQRGELVPGSADDRTNSPVEG